MNVTQVQSHQHQALMLTKDENIVDVSLTVQWVIDDAQAYLVNVREPKKEPESGDGKRASPRRWIFDHGSGDYRWKRGHCH